MTTGDSIRPRIPTSATTSACIAGLVAALLVSVACAEPDALARFRADGIQTFQSCLDRFFPLKATFATGRDRIDSTGFFWATDTTVTSDTDLVYLEVFDRQAATNSAGSPVSFSYRPDTATQPMRMELHPEQSCPDLNISLVVEGSVEFSTFGRDIGDTVTGELVEGTILDARTGDTVATSITGDWDFDIQSGSPSVFYPTYDGEDYRRNP